MTEVIDFEEQLRRRTTEDLILTAAKRSGLLAIVMEALHNHMDGKRGIHDDLAAHFGKLDYGIDPEYGGWIYRNDNKVSQR
jgi:predicted solute-binding protein